jgi:molybdopterin converting factor small subunit
MEIRRTRAKSGWQQRFESFKTDPRIFPDLEENGPKKKKRFLGNEMDKFVIKNNDVNTIFGGP